MLTVAKIEQAIKDAVRAGGDREKSDGAHGLTLIVGPNTAHWTVKYKWAGKADKMGIGPVVLNDIKASLDKARVRACEIREQAEAGINPKKAKAGSGIERTSPLFIDVAREVMADEVVNMKNPKSVANWARNINVHAMPLHGMQVHTIGLEDVAAIIRPMWKQYPKPARELRGRLAKVFTKVIASGNGLTGSIGDTNPANMDLIKAVLGSQPERIKEGFCAMAWEEVPAFMTQLRAMDRVDADMLQMKILTCSRSQELIEMRWDDIDEARMSWVIPGRKMKNGRGADIPLSAAAQAVLAKRRTLRQPGEEYVFPGDRGPFGAHGIMLDLMRDLGRREVPHGFRTAFRTWIDEATELSETTAEFVLHHIKGDDAQVAYRKGTMWKKRLAVLEAWAAYVMGTEAAATSHLQLVA